MKTMKMLMLGVTALSIGAGAALAQESPDFTTDEYWAPKPAVASPQAAPSVSRNAGHVGTFLMQSQPVNNFEVSGGESGGG